MGKAWITHLEFIDCSIHPGPEPIHIVMPEKNALAISEESISTARVRKDVLVAMRAVNKDKINLPFIRSIIEGIFDGHGQVPTKGLIATQRFVLGAIFVYQLALLFRFENGLDLCVGFKAFLKAA